MRKLLLPTLCLSFLFIAFFISADSNKPLKRLNLADSALQSAESSDSEEEYKKIKPLTKEPPLVIKSGGYFIEPEFIKAPEIIEEGKEPTKKDDENIEETSESQDKKNANIGKRVAALAEQWMSTGVRSVNISGRKVVVYNDCSNFVRSLYFHATGKDLFYEAQATGATSEEKTNMSSGVALLYAYMKRRQHYSTRNPRIGDIIFFDNTYDHNSNKRLDDPLTHVGVVISVDPKDETVTFIHANTGNPKNIYKAYLNTKYPDVNRKDGKVINTYLKRKYTWERQNIQFAGQLTRGYGGF